MHVLFWTNIFCIIAKLNAKTVSKTNREALEISDTTTDGRRSEYNMLHAVFMGVALA